MRKILFIFYFDPNKIEYAQNKTHEFKVVWRNITWLFYYLTLFTLSFGHFTFTSFLWNQGLSVIKPFFFFWQCLFFHCNCCTLDSFQLMFVSYRLHHNTHKQQDNGRLHSKATLSSTNTTSFLSQIWPRVCIHMYRLSRHSLVKYTLIAWES